MVSSSQNILYVSLIHWSVPDDSTNDAGTDAANQAAPVEADRNRGSVT